MTYEFRASYIYPPGERYNRGRGLSALTDDLDHARLLLRLYSERNEPYACEIEDLETGTVIASHGDMRAAAESMNRAWRLTQEGE